MVVQHYGPDHRPHVVPDYDATVPQVRHKLPRSRVVAGVNAQFAFVGAQVFVSSARGFERLA